MIHFAVLLSRCPDTCYVIIALPCWQPAFASSDRNVGRALILSCVWVDGGVSFWNQARNRKGLQMTTEERLNHMEQELAAAKRRNRWLMAIVGIAVVGLAAAWLVKEAANPALAEEAAKVPKPAQVIRATAFVLVDAKGRERGKFELLPEGPVLYLTDENGKGGFTLDVDENGPTLRMYGKNSKGSVGLVVDENGPSLRMYGENVKGGVRLDVYKDRPSLTMSDEKGKTRVKMEVYENSTGLCLFGESGKGAVSLSAHKDESWLRLLGENDKSGFMMFTRKDESWLRLFDENGKPTKSFP